jgi:hypothetical protein
MTKGLDGTPPREALPHSRQSLVQQPLDARTRSREAWTYPSHRMTRRDLSMPSHANAQCQQNEQGAHHSNALDPCDHLLPPSRLRACAAQRSIRTPWIADHPAFAAPSSGIAPRLTVTHSAVANPFTAPCPVPEAAAPRSVGEESARGSRARRGCRSPTSHG